MARSKFRVMTQHQFYDLKVKWDELIIFLIAIKASLSCARARSKVRVMTPRSRSRTWGQGCNIEVKVMLQVKWDEGQ